MKTRMKAPKLKIPSHVDMVTPKNLWKLILIFPTLSNIFERKDIVNNEKFPLNNEIATSRVISYMKYLGVLIEERGQIETDGNIIKKQYFRLTKKGQRLKETALMNQEDLFNVWKQILKESELYKALVTTDEFQKQNQISISVLKKLLVNSFSKKVEKTKERLTQAEKYMIRFLKENELFEVDGNYLIPFGETRQYIDDKIQYNFYHVKTDDYELRVRFDPLAFEMLQMQIDIARKKFESIKKSKKEEQKDE